MHLDSNMIPSKKAEYFFDEDKKIYVLKMYHRGLNHKLAQKFFKKPKYSNIKLDQFGSFIWDKIDGKRNIEQIANLLEKEFGQKIDPLYPRLFKYFELLIKNKFVEIKKCP